MKNVKNKLAKVMDKKRIHSLLVLSKENDSTVIGWRLVGEQKLTVALKIRFVRVTRGEIEIKILPGREEQFKEVLGGLETINLYLPDEAFMFQSNIKSMVDHDTFIVTMPKMVAQIDRREHMRLYLDDNLIVKLDFKKDVRLVRDMVQRFQKSCYDVSGGGVSFLVNKQESKFFKPGDIIAPVNVFFEGKNYAVGLEVVALYPIDANETNNLIYSGKKISLKWFGQDAEFSDAINTFVFKNVKFDDVA